MEHQLKIQSKEFEEERRAFDEKIKEFAREKAVNNEEKRALHVQIEELQRVRERSDEKYTELANEYKSIQERFIKLAEVELTDFKTKLEQAQGERWQLQSENERMISNLQQELEVSSKENELLRTQNSSLEKELNEVQAQYLEAQKSIEVIIILSFVF